MQKKIALMLDMPEGKQPGFYAQVVKGIAAKTQLFDRDKELLILDRPDDRAAVLEVLTHYKIDAEEMNVIFLPEDAELFDGFSDYGFETRTENCFLYEKLVYLFQFKPPFGEEAEPAQALLQFEEHLIARFTSEGEEYFAVDEHQSELMAGIAKAYKCTIKPA